MGLSGFLAEIWRLFNGWYLPGTRITPGAILFFYLALSFGVWLMKKYFMGGGDSDD